MSYNKSLLLAITKEAKQNKTVPKKKDTVVHFGKSGKKPMPSMQGYKQGPPPSGYNYMIPSDTLYNPTPYNIKATSDTGETLYLNPFDETPQTVEGANYFIEEELPTAQEGGWLDRYKRGGGYFPEYDSWAPPRMYNGGYISDKAQATQFGQYQDGGLLPKAQKGLTTQDSVKHQAGKILRYEQLRGGPGGAPLPQYSDPKYMGMLMNDIYPEIKKIIPNASAMEVGEAMDFIFNAGWDKDNKKITKDPRAFALQEYYREYDPSKLDKEGKWPSRKNPAYSFDQEYSSTIGKLPENKRRILMNKGRDWYYKNINNPAPGVPNSNYYDTWYGRIWNTNDFNDFNPNNPKFIPQRKNGGDISIPDLKQNNWLDKYK